jgi:hypothetical protein
LQIVRGAIIQILHKLNVTRSRFIRTDHEPRLIIIPCAFGAI